MVRRGGCEGGAYLRVRCGVELWAVRVTRRADRVTRTSSPQPGLPGLASTVSSLQPMSRVPAVKGCMFVLGPVLRKPQRI
jgi:hypothetical protein